jgi:hypothetical protein
MTLMRSSVAKTAWVAAKEVGGRVVVVVGLGSGRRCSLSGYMLGLVSCCTVTEVEVSRTL